MIEISELEIIPCGYPLKGDETRNEGRRKDGTSSESDSEPSSVSGAQINFTPATFEEPSEDPLSLPPVQPVDTDISPIKAEYIIATSPTGSVGHDLQTFDDSHFAIEEPTETSLELTETALVPAETFVEPAETYVEPAETYVEPAEIFVKPAETYVEPAEIFVKPADTSVKPVETSVELTETSMGLTEIFVKPTEIFVEPAESFVEPAESFVEPAQTFVEPAEISVALPGTSVEPTETSMELTETPVAPIETFVEPAEISVALPGTSVESTETFMELTETPVAPIETSMEPMETAVELPAIKTENDFYPVKIECTSASDEESDHLNDTEFHWLTEADNKNFFKAESTLEDDEATDGVWENDEVHDGALEKGASSECGDSSAASGGEEAGKAVRVEVPPPLYPTSWKVRASTTQEKAEFRRQERRRFENPHRAFTYWLHNYGSVVGPVKGACIKGDCRPRRHSLLDPSRPALVTIQALVCDAVARLPNGQGSFTDICRLLRDSQYLRLSHQSRGPTLRFVVKGAMQRLVKEGIVRKDTKGVWVYLHRGLSEKDFEYLYEEELVALEAKLAAAPKKARREADPSFCGPSGTGAGANLCVDSLKAAMQLALLKALPLEGETPANGLEPSVNRMEVAPIHPRDPNSAARVATKDGAAKEGGVEGDPRADNMAEETATKVNSVIINRTVFKSVVHDGSVLSRSEVHNTSVPSKSAVCDASVPSKKVVRDAVSSIPTLSLNSEGVCEKCYDYFIKFKEGEVQITKGRPGRTAAEFFETPSEEEVTCSVCDTPTAGLGWIIVKHIVTWWVHQCRCCKRRFMDKRKLNHHKRTCTVYKHLPSTCLLCIGNHCAMNSRSRPILFNMRVMCLVCGHLFIALFNLGVYSSTNRVDCVNVQVRGYSCTVCGLQVKEKLSLVGHMGEHPDLCSQTLEG